MPTATQGDLLNFGVVASTPAPPVQQATATVDLLSIDGTNLSASDILESELAESMLKVSTSSSSAPVSTSAGTPTSNCTSKNKKWSMVVMDEAGRQSDSLPLSFEDKERELQLKKYYEDKFSQLRSQVRGIYD